MMGHDTFGTALAFLKNKFAYYYACVYNGNENILRNFIWIKQGNGG